MLATPRVTMLRLQATPNCNLDCSYCYIPAEVRRGKERMSSEVLRASFVRLIEEDLLGERLAISWHGAEPLAAGIGFYEEAFELTEELLGDRVRVTHIFQTNGTLLDDRWCRLLADHHAQVGVSIDGSARQSASRVNWSGRATHHLTMRGTELLNAYGFPWALLAVVTAETMAEPDEFISFVRSTGCRTLGFKVEETNVAHASRLDGSNHVDDRYASFVQALWQAFPADGPIRVREFEDYRRERRRRDPRPVVPVTVIPLRNLTVAVNGDFTVFAGELLFGGDPRFTFGNVLHDSLLGSLHTERFQDVGQEVLAGVQRCARTCVHYRSCGSFFISQKYAEHGTFDATETLACRLEIKVLQRALDAL